MRRTPLILALIGGNLALAAALVWLTASAPRIDPHPDMVRLAMDPLKHLQRFTTGDIAECLCAFDVKGDDPAATEENR